MRQLNNWEVVVYALHLLNGATSLVSTEGIALKCYELVPESFSWVHFREHPDKDVARVALTDARKPKVGSLVTGRAGTRHNRGPKPHAKVLDGWMLTPAGVSWILANQTRIETLLQKREPRFHRQDLLRRIKPIRQSRMFLDYVRSPSTFSPSLGQLADLLKCRVDSDRSVWNKRLEVFRNQALMAEQTDLVSFVAACEVHLDRLIAT